jgi:putative peptidoglycan lipid II flippase
MNLYKSFSKILYIVLFIKVLDFIKSLILAANLGVSGQSDIFMALSVIPDGLIVLLGLDSIKGVLNSEYSRINASSIKKNILQSFYNLYHIIFIISLFFTIIILFFRAEIIEYFLPGFSDIKKSITITFAMFIFPTFLFKVLSGMIHSVFNSFQKFIFPIAINVITTLALVLAVLLPYIGNDILYNLSLAFLFSNILIFIISYFLFRKQIGVFSFKKIKIDSTTKNIFVSCFNLLLLLIFDQLFNFSKNFYASFFDSGSISALNYARSIPFIIITIIFTTFFSVLLTNLSASFERDKTVETRKMFIETINIVLFIFFPIILIFILNAENLLNIIYLRGNFDLMGIQMTLKPFYWESLSVFSFIMFMLPTALFLAKRKYKALNIIGSCIYCFGIFLSYILTQEFGFYGVSISHFFITLLYGIILILYSRKFFGKYLSNFKKSIIMLIAATSTLISFYLLNSFIDLKIGHNSFFELIISLIINSLIILIFYFAFDRIYKINYSIKLIKMVYR